jgi:hypothetical protein
LIKECIWGGPIRIHQEILGKGFVGRPCSNKVWLCDIFSNRYSGPIDYFARNQCRSFRAAGKIEKLMIEEADHGAIKCFRCTEAHGWTALDDLL